MTLTLRTSWKQRIWRSTLIILLFNLINQSNNVTCNKCNSLMTTNIAKQLTSYPFSTLIRLLDLIVYYFFCKIKFQSIWKIYLTSFYDLGFLFVPKTAKVVAVFKKDLKLDYGSPIYLLPYIKKTLEKLVYERLHTFINWIQTTILYMSYLN